MSKKNVDVVLGAFYGDEGKGAIANYLVDTHDYDAVVRFQGGNNAGHTITIGEEVYKLHLIPCGIISPGTLAIVGNGCVVDPKIANQELIGLQEKGVDVTGLRISDQAHVIFPYHRALDYIQEARRSESEKIGSTCRGISPAYSDKINRRGVRVQDLLHPDHLRQLLEKVLVKGGLQDQIREALEELEFTDEQRGFLEESLDIDQLVATYTELGAILKVYITDTTHLVWNLIDSNKKVLCEGAQGVFLDIDFGSYPFVTSSNMVPGAVSTGAGIPPQAINDVYGVLKAFGTRIDTVGPFPTLDTGEVAQDIIERGLEFGTTTGRRRRFGWIDLVSARYACRLAGINKLVVTKIDTLSGVKELKLCIGYKLPDGTVTENYPSDIEVLKKVEAVYETVPGWDEDVSDCRSFNDLPVNAQHYLNRIEQFTGSKIALVGVGPERDQTIVVE